MNTKALQLQALFLWCVVLASSFILPIASYSLPAGGKNHVSNPGVDTGDNKSSEDPDSASSTGKGLIKIIEEGLANIINVATNTSNISIIDDNASGVNNKGGINKDVNDKADINNYVNNKGGDGDDVNDKVDINNDVNNKGGDGDDVNDKGDDGTDVDDKGDDGTDVDDKGDDGNDVDDKGDYGTGVDDKDQDGNTPLLLIVHDANGMINVQTREGSNVMSENVNWVVVSKTVNTHRVEDVLYDKMLGKQHRVVDENRYQELRVFRDNRFIASGNEDLGRVLQY